MSSGKADEIARSESPGCRPLPKNAVYSRRMPRMQVYLPEDLYQQLKTRGLPASELLQQAIRGELRRQKLSDESDTYLKELIAEVGEPSSEDRVKAEDIAGRIKLSPRRAAG